MKKEDLEKQIEKLQGQLDKLNSYPEDTFNFGTIVLFSASSGQKWYYVKIEEETWTNLKGGTQPQRSLAEWILHTESTGIGYFEVYEMKVHPSPFYESPTEE